MPHLTPPTFPLKGGRVEFFTFTAPDLRDLHRLLGDRLEQALHGLQLGAAVYIAGREYEVATKSARRELEHLETLLHRIAAIERTLSRSAELILERTADHEAVLAGREYVTARTALAAAARASASALRALKRHRNRPMTNTAARMLAVAVAGGLSHANLPLSKGRDGLFARVLTLVWHAVEPERTPTEIFPYLRFAVDIARSDNPALAPPKGRPRRKR